MRTTFEIEHILYQMLVNAGILDEINGGVYLRDSRPLDSNKEDIVVNTLTLDTDAYPQTAVSNVNIYVPDVRMRINEMQQSQANGKRMAELTNIVLAVIRGTKVDGCTITPMSQVTLAEPSIGQHFVNIRCSWNINE